MSHSNPPCLVDAETNTIVDIFKPGELTPERLNALQQQYGTTFLVMPYVEAQKQLEAAYITSPFEIDPQHFHDALQLMPPLGRCNTGDTESFKCSEMNAGLITDIYVRIQRRYFTFADHVHTPHAECCARVINSPAFNQSKPDYPDR